MMRQFEVWNTKAGRWLVCVNPEPNRVYDFYMGFYKFIKVLR